jgi:hypothetical protein
LIYPGKLALTDGQKRFGSNAHWWQKLLYELIHAGFGKYDNIQSTVIL